jgi:hypothetical protein
MRLNRVTPRRRLSLDHPLRDAPERSIGLSLPLAISQRLDRLVTLVYEDGGRTSRKELVAALILATPTVPHRLSAAVRRYRRALVRDALPEKTGGRRVEIDVSARPGPRPRVR